jgi:hypothetical protein
VAKKKPTKKTSRKKARKPRLNKKELELLFMQQLMEIDEAEEAEERRPQKPTPTKRPRKKGKTLPVKTSHPRGTNYVEIILGDGPHNVKHVENTIENYDYSKLEYMRTKNRPIKGAGYRAPQGIVVVITVRIGENEWFYSKMTPYDFVVNKASMIAFIKQTYKDFTESWDENTSESDDNEPEGILLTPGEGDTDDPRFLDPRFIYAITVKFIYGPN